jgi:hypothetical protein
MAKTRNIPRSFTPTHQTKFKNLLVSGCSYVFNNSEHDACTWPYYLRDLANFDEVYDCSQSGAGANHVFNSILHECLTNPDINITNTVVVAMWPEPARTDVVASRDLAATWHPMSRHDFDSHLSTLSIFNRTTGRSDMDQLCRDYKRLVGTDGQVLESGLKITALKLCLERLGFYNIFVPWQQDLGNISAQVKHQFDPVVPLHDYAKLTNQQEPDGHPTPNGHLAWCQQYLVPWLSTLGVIDAL